MNKKYKEFIKQYPFSVKQSVKLSHHCTFKVGGPADLIVLALSAEELKLAVALAVKLKIPYLVIGGGSNVFFDDKGFKGLVIKYVADEIVISPTKSRVWVEAGCILGKLVKHLAKNNLGGFDFLANIPGSVGGAIVGNAGCYGKAIDNYVYEAEILNCKTGKVKKLKNADLGFKYRHSKLKNKPDWIVLSATLKVIKSNYPDIMKAVKQDLDLRKSKHPLKRSAGCFFKNPNDKAAWRLIDEVGLRGKTLGGARVSNKHSNHIVNYNGRAKAKDVNRLANLIVNKVNKKFGVKLEREARFVTGSGKVLN